MVCRFLDSFDYYATADMNRKYDEAGAFAIIQSGTVRTGPNAMRIQAFGTGFVRKVFDAQASWVIGYAFNISALPNTDTTCHLVRFIDDGTIQCTLRMLTDGKLEIVNGTTTAVTDGISSLNVSINTWYYMEVKVTIADSIGAGTCVVRINEVDWVTVATGQDLQVTGNATADQISINNASNGANLMYIDDLYMFDGTGAENNDFTGDVQVSAQFPNTNGVTNDFLGSDADSTDNYLLVDDADTDDDSTYTESSTAAQVDLYAFDQLAVLPDTIFAVQVNNVVTKDEAGSRTMRSVTRPLDTNFFGASASPSVGSYTNEITIYDLNPESGGVVWSEAGFNDTQFGIEVET